MDLPWTNAFLSALASGCTVSEAADAAGIASSTAYGLKYRDADFAEAWRLAMEDSVDLLEREARRRAIDGVEEPVIFQGQPTYVYETDDRGDTVMDTVQVEQPDLETGGMKLVNVQRPRRKLDADGNPVVLTVRKPSDSLLALLLKGRRKDVFSDRTELTGAGGGPVAIDATMRAARMAALLKKAQERKEIDDIV